MKTPKEYDVGSLVRVEGVFISLTGAKIDPTRVYCTITNPAGVATTYTYGTDAALVKDEIGRYHVDIDANMVGWWYRRIYSTGGGQAASRGAFRVI